MWFNQVLIMTLCYAIWILLSSGVQISGAGNTIPKSPEGYVATLVAVQKTIHG
jgi:hypothetical protein